MMWDDATEADLAKMVRWCQLRAAQNSLQGEDQGEVPEELLKKIFDSLDLDGDQRLSVEELYKGGVLTGQQIEKLMDVAEIKYAEHQQRTIALAALFGKHMEDIEPSDLGRLGGPLFDGELTFRDFCVAFRSGTISG